MSLIDAASMTAERTTFLSDQRWGCKLGSKAIIPQNAQNLRKKVIKVLMSASGRISSAMLEKYLMSAPIDAAFSAVRSRAKMRAALSTHQ
jgi:hypothetical protein